MGPAKAGRVETAPVAERRPDGVVVPGRQVLEHQRVGVHEIERIGRAPEQSHGRPGLIPIEPPDCRVHLEARELQPQLGRLMDRLEQQLVPVADLARIFLESEQLIRSQVAFVVGLRRSRQHRVVEVRHDRTPD